MRWPAVIYVSEVKSAMRMAKDAAGKKDVLVHGALTAQLALIAGVLDELQIHLIPVLFGQGHRLFENMPPGHIELDQQMDQQDGGLLVTPGGGAQLVQVTVLGQQIGQPDGGIPVAGVGPGSAVYARPRPGRRDRPAAPPAARRHPSRRRWRRDDKEGWRSSRAAGYWRCPRAGWCRRGRGGG
jgi:hypothetical protein